jgi:hypothetical protein
MSVVTPHEKLLDLALNLVHPVEIFVVPEAHTTKRAALTHVKQLPREPRPTDIVVVGDQAFHYHDGQLNDPPARVRAGAAAAPDPTVVHLSAAAQDFIVWYSDQPFAISEIRPIPTSPDRPKPYRGPNNPFYRMLPFGNDDDGDKAGTRVVVSGPIQLSAADGLFKVSLRINGVDVDPHIATAP